MFKMRELDFNEYADVEEARASREFGCDFVCAACGCGFKMREVADLSDPLCPECGSAHVTYCQEDDYV